MSSTQDMNKYNANRDYLLDLHDEKTSIDESYKPITWFDVKHECEGPGLMNEITPNKISSPRHRQSMRCRRDLIRGVHNLIRYGCHCRYKTIDFSFRFGFCRLY